MARKRDMTVREVKWWNKFKASVEAQGGIFLNRRMTEQEDIQWSDHGWGGVQPVTLEAFSTWWMGILCWGPGDGEVGLLLCREAQNNHTIDGQWYSSRDIVMRPTKKELALFDLLLYTKEEAT